MSGMARTTIPKDSLPPLASITDGAIAVPDPNDSATGGDITFQAGPPDGRFLLVTRAPWWRRIWYALTNPLVYIFRGHIRW